MKKPFTPFLLLLLMAISSAQADGLPVVQDFTIEASESKEKRIPILVLFMSESCSYCEVVLNDFLLPMQRDAEYTDKVILRQIDTDSTDPLIDFKGSTTTHRKFSRKYVDWGTPTVVTFDSQGNVLTTIVGLLTVDFYFAFLDNAINDSLQKIRGAEKQLE